jgi:hypothetical protein
MFCKHQLLTVDIHTHIYNLTKRRKANRTHTKCLHILHLLFQELTANMRFYSYLSFRGIESYGTVKVNDFLITLVNVWTKEEKVQSYTDNSSILFRSPFLFFLFLLLYTVYDLNLTQKKNRTKRTRKKFFILCSHYIIVI